MTHIANGFWGARMLRPGRALAIAFFTRMLSACSTQGTISDDDLQSLCERSNNLQDVEFYSGAPGVPTAFVNRHRRAVGLLRFRSDLKERYLELAGNVSGRGWCTGTLIDEDLFLTAGHCLDTENSGTWKLPHEKGGVALRPAELAREFIVEFRNELPAHPSASGTMNVAEVVRLEEYRLGNLDYAIVRLGGSPGVLNGVARISPHDAEAGDTIAILQHPAAVPMEVGVGSVARVKGTRIGYDTIDTLGGSSGSGILDAKSGKLVGIHTNGGCTKNGPGQNFGVTISALIAASPTVRNLVDPWKDFLVGDWDNDGLGDLGIFNDGCFYPDVNHDGDPDENARRCPAEPNADSYFAGRWEAARPSGLGWRVGGCVFLDSKPKQPLCFGNDRFEVLIADWNGDGRSDLGILRDNCISFDTDLDGTIDQRGYCYGDGLAEDEYLAGNWDGSPHDSIAIRRGNALFVDADRDGKPDAEPRIYGKGGADDQYLVGDWNGDHRADLAVRRKSICLMNHDATTDIASEGRVYNDFWSAP